MSYYNREYQKLNLKITKKHYLNHGQNASIFLSDNTIVKKYYNHTPAHFRISTEIFDILKKINNKHFIELYEIYCQIAPILLPLHQKGIIPFTVSAYTAKYYINENINILYEPTDYIISNLEEIEKLIDIFSNNQIITRDLTKANTIINSQGIILIDPDLFHIPITPIPRKNIITNNKFQLLSLLESIWISSIYKKENVSYNDINNLFNIPINETTSITDEIYKKLKYTKHPINYFSKHL